MTNCITVEHLHKQYGEVYAVKDISFSIPRGEVVAVLGPNGAGKTTTMEMLEGFRKRTSGKLTVLGEDPERASQRWRARIGFVLQSTSLEGNLTVVETLRMFRSLYPHPRPLGEILEMTELFACAEQRVGTLSGGQQRRVDLAIGLIGRPELLFLDEPTTGFDPEVRRRIWDAIRKLQAEGMTTILTTHYLDEAEQLADRIIVIDNGQIIANASPKAIEAKQQALIRCHLTSVQYNALPGQLKSRARYDRQYITLSSPTPTEDLSLLLTWGRKQAINLNSLEVRRPSLEEIYLTLTAKPENI